MGATYVGSALRQARERQGLSIDDIVDRTKIAPHLLEAIERNELDQVPGGLFTKGYLRAYASAVDLDGECLVGEYLAHVEGPEVDVLDKLRARFPERRREIAPIFQLVVVLTGLACLLFFLTREPAPPAEADIKRDEQVQPVDKQAEPVEVSSLVIRLRSYTV